MRRPGSAENGGDGPVTVIVAGGGTAGHTNPGIAVAQSLVKAGLDESEILFVGSQRGNEGTIVPEAGFRVALLPGRGIKRSLSLASIRDNIGAVLALLRGQGQAVSLLRRYRPRSLLCLGGFAAAAPSMAAVVLRVPIVVTEQNARASAVNRMVARFARRCALPYPDTDLPRGEVTGNPIRHEVLEAVRSADPVSSRAALGISQDRFVIAVWAGSLGALRINTAVRELARNWADRGDVAIYHVVGKRDWERFGDASELADSPLEYLIVEYENRMPLLLNAADMAVCRGGASTAAELAVVGLPAVGVPLPGAPRDHQRANLAELSDAGALVVLDDAEVSPETLARLIGDVISAEGEKERRSKAALSVARPGAADRVAKMVLDEAGLEVTGDY